MNKYWISLLCLLGSTAVLAQIADGGLEVAAEHARIRAERQQIEQRFADEEVACFKKFAVNDCRDASRARRRADRAGDPRSRRGTGRRRAGRCRC